MIGQGYSGAWGSSPLTRGKLHAVPMSIPPARLIPTHAGKTTRRTPSQSKPGADPRSRGENAYHDRPARRSTGSSPLTRGKHKFKSTLNFAGRLIPAHAGKTLGGIISDPSAGAHPRSRGENEALAASDATDKGSSPLTRGKLPREHARRRLRGLIPAHAGKTSICRARDKPATAHPRSRGENGAINLDTQPALGSSPLTRGKLIWSVMGFPFVGLIPAHAGKTDRRSRPAWAARTHPRSRGENSVACALARSPSGSSPLTRGKLARALCCVCTHRLIPAHAGKTSPRAMLCVYPSAHPRSRGENVG